MATRMQQRRGTAAQWISTNNGDGPVLNAGEIGFETDTGKFKVGDGTNHWVDLEYFIDESQINNITDNYVLSSTLAQPNGVATLDGAGKLTTAQIPNVDELAQDAVNTALTAGTGITKTYNDNANTITLAVDTSVIATKAELAEVAQDSINDALVAGTGLDKTYDDATNTLTIDIDSTVTTNSGTQTLTNKTISAADNNVTINTTDIVDVTASAAEINVLDGITATTAELNILDGVTATAAEINTLDGITADVNELNVLDGITASTAELNILDGVTASAVELNILDGATLSTTELNYVDGVTSSIQTQLDDKLSKTGGTMSGALTLSGSPTSDLHAATKLYVDNVTAGINFHQAVHVATTANLSADYNNGTNGVGATLTASSNGAWPTIDGHSSFTQYDRILVKDQTDAKQNGIYVLSDLGSGSSKWILTRATDADNNPSGEMKNGDFVLVLNGTANGSYGFVNNSTANPIAIGTDNITYSAFNAAKAVAAGNGLQEATPGVLSIDTSITQTRVSGVSDTEIGYLDGVTSGIQSQLDTKSPINNPTFTGTVVLPSTTSIGTVSATEISYVDGVTSSIQTQLDSKAPTASPTFTGTVTLPTGTVTSGMILDGTIVNGDISATAAIAATKIAGTAVTQADTGTVTNAMLAGSIANNKLANSSITVNGSAVSLGGSVIIAAGATPQAVSSNITMQNNYNYFVDTTAARTLTLPASPALGDTIAIYDASGTAATNNITIARNGNKINGLSDDAVVDVNQAVSILVYTGTTLGWKFD